MTPRTLLGLPTEILCHIASYLSYSSHFALHMTCQTLHFTLPNPNASLTPPQLEQPHPAPTPQSRKFYNMFDLIEIECWPCYSSTQPNQRPSPGDFFACCNCLKVLPADVFCNDMIEGLYGKSSEACMKFSSRMERLCVPCGIERWRYYRGLRMLVGAM